MKGYAWTVLQGTQPEPLPMEILGIYKNQWGPKQDVILAKLGGKGQRTNVAAGMSGSPVYIDGKLVGAIALRFSTFSPDALCGITPIELMLEVNEFDDSRPSNARVPGKSAARNAASADALSTEGSTARSNPFPDLQHGSHRDSAEFRGFRRKRSAYFCARVSADGNDRGRRWRGQHHDQRQAGARMGNNRCNRAMPSAAFWSLAT